MQPARWLRLSVLPILPVACLRCHKPLKIGTLHGHNKAGCDGVAEDGTDAVAAPLA